MIQLQISEENYEYDIRGLLMAFYPHVESEQVPGGTDDSGAPAHEEEPRRHKRGEKEEKPWRRQLLVQYGMVQTIVLLRRRETSESEERGDAENVPAFTDLSPLQAAVPTDLSSRANVKNALKRTLYALFQKDTGQSLPWGTLTGIRPTKIAMGRMEEGASEEDTAAWMESEYLVSEEKARLSVQIARRETEVLKDIDYENGYSIYVGIPFCPTTCLYCSFTSYPIAQFAKKVDSYLDAVEQELAFTAEAFGEKKLQTVYFGGGTPTTLKPGQLDRILSFMEEHFDLTNVLEYTVEAGRPDSITEEKLAVLRRHNISRISINPQSMKQETLDLIGRRHTVGQVRDTFRLARSMGFDNINMDIILGLPEETTEDVRATMEELVALAPDNITVHSLAIKRAARLNRFWEQYSHLSMVNSDETMAVASEGAARLGLAPYYLYRQKNMAGNLENVGFAAPGKEGLYNILMMEEKQSIVAIGAGSTSKAVFADGLIERTDNVKDVDLYLKRIDEMIDRKRKLFRLPES